MLHWIVPVTVVLSSIWVWMDARSIGVERGQITGLGNLGPLGWLIACLGLWLVAFPFYLLSRPALLDANGRAPGPFPVRLVGLALVVLVGFVTVQALQRDSRPSLEEIQRQTLASMEATFAGNAAMQGVRVRSIEVTHVDGARYRGRVELEHGGRVEAGWVNIIHDGAQLRWEVTEAEPSPP